MEQRCSKCKQDQPISEFYRLGNPWCKTCYRTWYQDRNGGLLSRSCDHCRTEMQVTARRAAESRVFCSRPCKDRYRSDEAIRQRAEAKKPQQCPDCGKVFTPKRTDAVFCSVNCNSRAHMRTRNYLRRAVSPQDRDDGYVLAFPIAERDGWKCGLCRKPIHKRRKHPDPLALSIDHVIPLSKGGAPTDPANLQAVHLRCNLSKRAEARQEQLKAF